MFNTNIPSLIAQHRLSQNTTAVNRSFERLASGYRINRSADDAAGLSIAQTLRGQTVSSQKALHNTQDGINMLQIVEGALNSITDNLQRMRELTVQAANDSNTQAQRDAIALEIRTLTEEIDRVSNATQFNGVKLLDGSNSSAGVAEIQIGPNSVVGTDTMDVSAALISSASDLAVANGGIGVIDSGGGLTFASLSDIYSNTLNTSPVLISASAAGSFLTDLDSALTRVNRQRATIGAMQNQMGMVVENLQRLIVNYQSSESKIRDLDIAEESANLAQNQVLQQASLSVLSQANLIPEQILTLLNQ